MLDPPGVQAQTQLQCVGRMLPGVTVQPPAACLAFAATLLVCALPATAARACLALTVWALVMSFADWSIHRYMLHDGRSCMPHWRHAHRVHHVEFDTGVGRSGVSLTFSYMDIFLFATVTLPVAFAAGVLVVPLRPPPLAVVVLAHFFATACAVGVHNYCHTSFHGYKIPHWRTRLCVPVPSRVCEVLHEHHARHHEDAGVNYCTVLLGFDMLAGTAYEPERNLGYSLPCCWWPRRHWSHKQQAVDAGWRATHGAEQACGGAAAESQVAADPKRGSSRSPLDGSRVEKCVYVGASDPYRVVCV